MNLTDACDTWYLPLDLQPARRVQTFLAVNPSDPTSVAMDAATVEHSGRIVRERPERIVITDAVRASFVRLPANLYLKPPASTVLTNRVAPAVGRQRQRQRAIQRGPCKPNFFPP